MQLRFSCFELRYNEMVGDKQTKALASAAYKLLRPLVRILLRNGIPYGVFADIAKRAYVDVATQDFGVQGRKQTVSRVSVITGLSRKEVARVQKLPQVEEDIADVERHNRAARVVAAWVREPQFHDADGLPAALALEDAEPSFKTLVAQHSGDVPMRAVLDELRRVGAVEQMDNGRLRLLERAYVPRTGEVEKLGILGTDVAGLLATIDRNLRPETSQPFFQRKVFYDNLPAEAVPELKEKVADQGQKLLESLDQWMAEHDRDTNPNVKGTGRCRAGIGVFYFEEPGNGEK